jgi:hypothetical protein
VGGSKERLRRVQALGQVPPVRSVRPAGPPVAIQNSCLLALYSLHSAIPCTFSRPVRWDRTVSIAAMLYTRKLRPQGKRLAQSDQLVFGGAKPGISLTLDPRVWRI